MSAKTLLNKRIQPVFDSPDPRIDPERFCEELIRSIGNCDARQPFVTLTRPTNMFTDSHGPVHGLGCARELQP